ncbi:MAG: chemotaxis protein CheW [Bryobacteraceae bacterium]
MQLATFWAGGHLFGIPVERVQEVLRDQPETKIPLAPQAVRGVMNLRGQIVTGIDLPLLLGDSAEGRGIHVIVQWEDELVSLRANRIGDVVSVEESAPSGRREQLTGRAQALVEEIYEWRDRLVLVLDTQAAVERAWAGAPPQESKTV